MRQSEGSGGEAGRGAWSLEPATRSEPLLPGTLALSYLLWGHLGNRTQDTGLSFTSAALGGDLGLYPESAQK